MIKLQNTLPAFFTGIALTITGCTSDATSSSQRAIIQTPCASSNDCPANFECEIEVEHGQTTSFCQSHDEGDTCPAGFELEVEHGQNFCKPHGGQSGKTSAEDRANRAARGNDDGAAHANDDSATRGNDDGAAHTNDDGAAHANDDSGARRNDDGPGHH